MLQGQVDQMLRLQEVRAKMYANQMGEGARRRVNNAAEEKVAISEGFDAQVVDDAVSPELQQAATETYPKEMFHPGLPNGGATGMLVKDYRGKNA